MNKNTATPLFNGNIAETFWKTSTDNIKRKYNYKYDDLNRLLQADYSKQGSTVFNSYLEHLTYDKNGNIQTLLRNGNRDTDGFQFENPIDNLTYLYDDSNKNQLLRVFDATANQQGFVDDTDGMDINQDIEGNPDYAYDANGNMTRDDNKGITNITYNHLNLPVKIYFGGDNNIEYLYNATGQKVSKKVIQIGVTTTTDYLSGFQYKKKTASEPVELQFFPHAEGYVNVSKSDLKEVSAAFNYVFNYTDHLGNIRLSYSQDPSNSTLKVIEENHYYPFGLKHTGYNSDKMMLVKEASMFKIRPVPPLFKTSYNYKYNGKEYQDELGLNMYDYGARNYDPAIGRWMNIDPMAETYYTVSPYVYVANNPLLFIDPTGMKIEDPDKIVEKQKSMLNSTITDIKSFIKNGALGEELGNKLIGVAETNLNEISDMEKSDQVYNVYTNNDITGVTYDKATDKVMIGLNAKDDYGLIGHELKHGYQFEKGKVSLMADNSSYGSLYDVSDETEAYNRERQLKGGRDYFENPSSLVWKNEDVLNLGKTMVPPAYQGLPTGPININSKEGKALRNKTIEAGKNGQTVQEVYKGWQKDYAKGAKTKG